METHKANNNSINQSSCKNCGLCKEVWSENQADKYYEMLISNSQEIADNPNLGKNYDGITKSLLGMKTNRLIIFYRTLNENYVHEDFARENGFKKEHKRIKTTQNN